MQRRKVIKSFVNVHFVPLFTEERLLQRRRRLLGQLVEGVRHLGPQGLRRDVAGLEVQAAVQERVRHLKRKSGKKTRGL